MTGRRMPAVDRGAGSGAGSGGGDPVEFLVSGAEDVPRARRLVRDVLTERSLAGVVDDAELCASELIGNGLLHAGPPVRLVLSTTGHLVRIEVHDASRARPRPVLGGTESMTGRGLGLIGMLSSRLRVDITATGKVVWCELDGDQPQRVKEIIDLDLLLDQWAPETPGRAARQVRYPVVLTNVPTELLLRTKEHTDAVVRELALLRSSEHDAPPGSGRLWDLIDTVVRRFAEQREEIRAQALAARQRASPRCTLRLELSTADADAAEDYLNGLAEADTFSSAARLLTVVSPPEFRALRTWYIESLVAQVRAAASGAPAPAGQSFEERLIEELRAVTVRREHHERSARLQRLGARLVGAVTTEMAASVVLEEGVAALRALGGGLLLPTDGDRLRLAGAVGYPAELVERLHGESGDADLPAAVALRTGEPVWVESATERDLRFPALAGLESHARSWCALPLIVEGRILGALRFSFRDQRLFGPDERDLALTLAALSAQAIDRARLYEREAVHQAPGLRSAGRVPHPGSSPPRSWYDALRLPGGTLVVAAVDLRPADPASAVDVLRLRHRLESAIELDVAAPRVLEHLATGLPAGQEVSCLLLELEAGTGRLTWANAGHPPPFIVPTARGRLIGSRGRQLVTTGPALSARGGRWSSRTTRLRPTEAVVIASAGMLDAHGDGPPFGRAGVLAALDGQPTDRLAALPETCLAAVRAHVGTELGPDVTVAVLTRHAGLVTTEKSGLKF